MQGKIIKGIGGFYYVDAAAEEEQKSGIYECRAKGIFRKERIKPLVGDNVRIEVISKEERTGNIEEILPRRNQLVRPAVANVDQALVIFASMRPAPNLNLLDRFLLMMQKQQVPTVICFNKADLVSGEEIKRLRSIYENSGSRLLFTSALEESCERGTVPSDRKCPKGTVPFEYAGETQGLEALRELLLGKTTTVAGPSGVGKSSLINALGGELLMETGAVSEKIDRGKHTTRHSQLIPLGQDTYIMDTPGFSSLYVEDMEKEELKDYIPEFYPYEGSCRFLPCTHTHEPGCRVKEALEEGKISRVRYENYVLMYEELKNKRRY